MNVKRKSRSETKREAILCAAKQAFQEFGVQNTSMDKLSSIAQVSKRTVYNHFPSKEAIVTELLTELWRSSMMDSDIERLPTLPLKQQLIELLYSEIVVVTEPNYIELAKVAFGHFCLSRKISKNKLNACQNKKPRYIVGSPNMPKTARLRSKMWMWQAFSYITCTVNGDACFFNRGRVQSASHPNG